MNRWNIPDWLEQEIIERDTHCVYCGIKFISSNGTRDSKPSWEHIINDETIITRENIVRCCISCNASKGAKLLSDWLESNYCKKRNITKNTVAPIIRMVLESNFSIA